MTKLTCFGKADSLAVSGQIKMPLVVVRVDKAKFNGFIPGLTAQDVVESNLNDCKQKLNSLAKEIVTAMAQNNLEFPFFPTKEEIMHDFENVVDVTFITIKSNKRKA